MTPYSVTMGLVMAVVFSAAAAFLGLKVGQVFEAAIPIAIIAVGAGNMTGRRNMLGQNVIIQSIGASSGVIVAGAIFTLPALYILGLDAAFWQVFLSSLFGGLLGIVLMIAILIFLFGDYRKPTIILCGIPLIAIGVVGAMLITGQTFTFCAIVGVLGLVGMMMKNCIVLMDEIGDQIAAGKEPVEALLSSSESRLRPVMMASLTTILGMIPLLSDAMFGSMAATIMGGLLFSTFATLFFVPILYAIFFKIQMKR